MQSLQSNLFPSLIRTGSHINNQEDTLARESDVIVSAINISKYVEYKGFFIYVISALVLGAWTTWMFIPDNILRDYLGIDYYPDKYWSHAIPAYSLILMLYVYIALALYNTEVRTLALDDIRNFVDDHSLLPGSLEEDLLTAAQKNLQYIHRAPSGVWDLPISLVNEVLYGDEDE